MKSWALVLPAAIIMLISALLLAQTDAEESPHAPPVSIVTLLAQPASHHTQRVQVSGFLVLDFEGESLYLHKEDYQEGLSLNRIYLSLTPAQQKQYKALDKSYVTIEASFQKLSNSEEIFTGVLFHVREIRKITLRGHLASSDATTGNPFITL